MNPSPPEIKSKLLDSIPLVSYGFGNRFSPVPPELLPYWEHRPNWKQVHGKNISLVATPGQICGETDGLWCEQSEIPIAIVTADCVPILFAHRFEKKIGAVHAGWRGTRQQIALEFVNRVENDRTSLDNWVAVIGPSIRGCCYAVNQEIVDHFGSIVPGPFEKWATRRESKWFIDLATINQLLLQANGLCQIEILEGCTLCSKNLQGDRSYFSYRGGDLTQRQYSGLVLV